MFNYPQTRPIVIAERHNQSWATFWLFKQLRKNPLSVAYLLFEGDINTENHILKSKNSFALYKSIIQHYLKTDNLNEVLRFIYHDLEYETAELAQFSQKFFEKSDYPHGFGQIRNLSVHYLLYELLTKTGTQFISIDDKRKIIKEFATKKVADKTATSYKKHHNIGKLSSDKEIILVEAAIIRSKYMNDKIYHYAMQGQVIALIGARHAGDFITYTPELCTIIGYAPHAPMDNNLYEFIYKNNQSSCVNLERDKTISDFVVSLFQWNSKRIKSEFGLTQDYINFLSKIS